MAGHIPPIDGHQSKY